MGQDTFVSLGGCRFSPEEISAAILSELKFQAEKYLDRKFSKAVITVPAFFQDHQRQATIEAGKLANLDVIRIINEPTAAAVAYDTKMENNQRILVYDLGGGTFDVSLVLVENGVVEVKSSHGDTFLGGDDFDQLILELLFDSIYNKHQIDLSSNTAIRYRLWKAVEKAKRELSDSPFAKIQEEFITGDIHIDFELSRSEYEQLITPILMQTLDCVHHCLKDAACLPSSIDRILLVGGATRTPLIHSMLQKEFGILPRHEINPDLIVSMGAAIHGAVISGSKHHSILVDITPHTFGTGVLEMEESGANPEKYIPIIKRNTPLPASKTEAFSTVYDNQETIEVTVYQGENENVSDNFL
ncbi:MAG: Hsp70 family protein, partial [Fibrobacter sp.]|nr:Hsp70 family protein [Fibrobacter sp.]